MTSYAATMKEGAVTRSNGALKILCEMDERAKALVCMKFNLKGGLMENAAYNSKGKKRHGPYRKYFGNNKQKECPFIKWDKDKQKMISKSEINICVEPLRISAQGQYANGKKVGEWISYYKDGEVKSTKQYKNAYVENFDLLLEHIEAFDLANYAEIIEGGQEAARDVDSFVPRDSEDDEEYDEEEGSEEDIDEDYSEDDTEEEDELYEEE